MPRSIVVPLVGPELDAAGAAEQALPYARSLANRLDADLRLLSVVPTNDMIASRERYLSDIGGEVGTCQVVVADEPADAIVALVDALDDAIVVMASHSRTGLQRMLLGSVALRVVLGTNRPVLVVPVSEHPVAQDSLPDITNLLLPLDDSFMADAVLRVAIDTLGPDGLALHLIDVIEPLSTRAGFMEGEYQSTVRQVATHYLNRVSHQLQEDGFLVEWQIRVGDPAAEIATVARESGSDLIVMSTHGRSGLGRLIFSSVGRHVAASGTVPLLLFRPDEDEIDRAREAARVVRTSR